MGYPVIMTERHEVILPFVRTGLEQHKSGMEPRSLRLNPLNLELCDLTLLLLSVHIDQTIARDLLLDIEILVGEKLTWRTNGFVLASLLNERPFARAVMVPGHKALQVRAKAKALRDLHVDACIRSLVSVPVTPLP